MRTSTAEVSQLLDDIGGTGPLKSKVRNVLSIVRWRDKAAANRVRHLLRGEQRPSLEQVDDIKAAYARHCVEKVEANRAENERLLRSLRRFIDTASGSDPAFFGPQIEAASTAVLQLEQRANPHRRQD